MKRSLTLLLPLALVACQDTPAPFTPDAAAPDAPSLSQSAGGEVIPGQYIVVFRDGVADAPGLARRLVAENGGELRFTYQHTIRGFAGRLPDQAIEGIRRNPNVAYVEQDRVVRAVSTTQTGATWGIDRIDQQDMPLNATYVYGANGSGVRVYILDTGINLSHQEFSGRLIGGFDAITSGGSANDCNGHGTHVAGTVGGTVYGVAKAVRLSPVRVLDCRGSGSTSGVIAGVDWVTANHVKPAVANMSLGGGASTSLDDAVRRSVAAGVTYALAAGNSTANACNSSPARVAEALTVGSTTSTDGESSFSNWGTCVNILAPGSSITSAWWTSSTAINTISGTSMASPHVAGAAALYLQLNPGATPAAVGKALVDSASVNKITLSSTSASNGTPNRLLFTGFIGGGTTPPPGDDPPPPVTGAPSSLTASGVTPINGRRYVDLAWTKGTASSVDIRRTSGGTTTVINTSNTGSYRDNLGRVGGTFTYRVCIAGAAVNDTNCSNTVSVNF